MFLSKMISALLLSLSAYAIEIPPSVENEYLQMGGPRKALEHAKCFLANYGEESFNLKKPESADPNFITRCNNLVDGGNHISMENYRYMVIVDYTAPSSQRRFYLLDLSASSGQLVRTLYVAHGRYNTTHTNTTLAFNKNSVKTIQYFSNVPDSNASASGFYITGKEYHGAHDGPNNDKNSMILHGISKNRNEYSCERAIVLHGSSYVNEFGSKAGVQRMSSGCFMLDYQEINQIIALIRGGGGQINTNESEVGGTIFYSYGVDEANQPSNLYCTAASEDYLRVD